MRPSGTVSTGAAARRIPAPTGSDKPGTLPGFRYRRWISQSGRGLADEMLHGGDAQSLHALPQGSLIEIIAGRA